MTGNGSMRGQADAFEQMFIGPVLGLIATVVSLRFNFLVTAAIILPALYLYLRTLMVKEPVAAEIGEPGAGSGE